MIHPTDVTRALQAYYGDDEPGAYTADDRESMRRALEAAQGHARRDTPIQRVSQVETR